MASTQTEIWDVLDRAQAVPRTASGDPRASERAEFKMRESGRMRTQAVKILEIVKQFPGATSRELGVLQTEFDRYQIARRLPELLAARQVTRTDEETESRWWPV